MSETKILVLDATDPDSLWKISVTLMSQALKNAEKRAAMDAACNDTMVDRRELLSIGFSFGVAEMSSLLAEGKLHKFPREDDQRK